MGIRQRQVLIVIVVGFLLASAVLLTRTVADNERIGTSGAIMASAGVATAFDGPPATVVNPPPTTGTSVAAVVGATTTTQRRPTTTKAPATTTTTGVRPAVTAAPTPALAPGAPPPAAAAVAPTSTTTTIVDPCRNSTDETCGPFRFDPQPGADEPMTVAVTIEPASPVAGQPVVFHVTLTDPDGVSFGSSIFNYGTGGLGETSSDPCARFGAWAPPARDPSSATRVLDVGYTYFGAGSHTATFAFDAGPFDCTDIVTGRGDRPYASSATGSVTVVVAPAP